VLTADRVRKLRLPDRDFWLFDDTHVALMHFGPDGVTGVELFDDPGTVRTFREVRDRAWNAAVPYRDWDSATAL